MFICKYVGTPQTTSTITNLQDVEHKKPEESSSRKAKRPLFQDEPANQNPQKVSVANLTNRFIDILHTQEP